VTMTTRCGGVRRRRDRRESEPFAVVFAPHPVAACVDLRTTFTGRFRFTWDESYHAETPDRRPVEAPWLTRIACRYGFIAPHGGRRLMAYTTTRRRALAALPGVTVQQHGEGEISVTFDVAEIESVARVLGARRPRRLSEETHTRLRRQGFQPHTAEILGVRSGHPQLGQVQARPGGMSAPPPQETEDIE
jgi:hypothetical protein